MRRLLQALVKLKGAALVEVLKLGKRTQHLHDRVEVAAGRKTCGGEWGGGRKKKKIREKKKRTRAGAPSRDGLPDLLPRLCMPV